MGTLANSEDQDEMQHNAAFHLGLHCVLRLKQSSGTKIHHNLEKSTSTQCAAPLLHQFVWKNPSECSSIWLGTFGIILL